MKKTIFGILFLFWLGAILTIFYVVQKPDFLSILHGLKNILFTVGIPVWMLLLSACIGSYFMPHSAGTEERLSLGSAIGMGILGLAGFGLAISGWATQLNLIILAVGLTGYFLYTGKVQQVWLESQQLADELKNSAKKVSVWIPISSAIAIGLALIMGLAPPIEDFDALLYHLTVPVWWLRDNAIYPSTSVGYWVPHTVEGSYIYLLVFGADSASHLIHLIWLVLTMLLVWHWARQIATEAVAWNSIAIMLTMPSLLWLASWAYNDFTLAFTGTAVIYAVWRWQDVQDDRWAIVGGLMAGLAMGAKYQSFFMPVIGGIFFMFWGRSTLQQRFKTIFLFGLSAFLLAFIWYARNWIWMGNPIYPFAFGGKQWDIFLTAVQPGIPGSGMGYDLKQILLLPLTATLGTKDANFFDGRFGPFFLILFPLAIWYVIAAQQESIHKRRAYVAISALTLTGIVSWVMGVINISSLFQGRYLFPSLIPLTILLSMGLSQIAILDKPRLKISFIFQSILAIAVVTNLFNFSLFTLLRNPLSTALGMTTRQQYMEKVQPGYARALQLVNSLPESSHIYLLFEPRSYGMTAYVEPDSLLVNLEHNLWLYNSPEKVFNLWKSQGYSHILLSREGEDFKLKDKPQIRAQLQQIEEWLVKVGETEEGEYELFKIP